MQHLKRAIVFVSLCLSFAFSLFAQQTGVTRHTAVPMLIESWQKSAHAPGTMHIVSMPGQPTAADLDNDENPRMKQARDAAESRALERSNAAQSITQLSANNSAILGAVYPGPPVSNYPPDSQIAAGPTQILVAVNSSLFLYDKSTGNLASETSLFEFFNPEAAAGYYGCFDPRILYDSADGRFVVICAYTESYYQQRGILYLAVSQTSDPAGNWNKYTFDVSQGGTYHPDFPGLGISRSAVYIAFDNLPFSYYGNEDTVIRVIGIPELLSGNVNLNITDFHNVEGVGGLITEAIQPALEYDLSDAEYLLSAKDLTSLNLFSINTSGTPTLNVTNLPIPTIFPADWAAQPGTSDLIHTSNLGGENVLSPVLRNGSLWCTQAASNMNGPDGVSVVRWYEIKPDVPKVKQWGNIFGAGAAYDGAITVLDDGEVFLTYSTSSSSQYASAAYASRAPGDPQGSMPIQGIYFGGQSYFTGSRWGDLSGISPDPDGTSVWGLAEYAGGFPYEGDFNYGTALVKLLSRHDQ